jgi:hypothetical protein
MIAEDIEILEYLKKKQNKATNIADWQMNRFAIEALEERIQRSKE